MFDFDKVYNHTDEEDLPEGGKTPVTKINDRMTFQGEQAFHIICEEEPEGYELSSAVKYN